MVQLVVSELVTNAHKYAPGPCLLDLEISDAAVQVCVWGSSTTLPSVLPADPGRIGQHGLEIVMAVCRSFAVDREPVGKRITVAVVLVDAPPRGRGRRPGTVTSAISMRRPKQPPSH
ncbi:ATP-binding protein [Streptomyces phaeochromogenes]|uniref:ATP-binding protein n=1 Tax=Streptomyces phaeochromogenes TaxID=1923 RepID=UPI0036BA7835